MKALQQGRERAGVSQRGLAGRAGIAYKSLQLIEQGGHNASVHTLEKLAGGLGFGARTFHEYVNAFFLPSPDAVVSVSRHILAHRRNWQVPVFNFVDDFRRHPDPQLIEHAPCESLDPSLRALLASTVETLCDEAQLVAPLWCRSVPALDRPWFVAGFENLKASALLESPLHFRKRNIFVLANFLDRV